MASSPTLSDLVAARVRKLREDRGMTVRELAERCKALGMPKLTAQALYKLEAQRTRQDRPPRPVTVDELAVLAAALKVPPGILVPELLQRMGTTDASLFNGLEDMITRLEHIRDEVFPRLQEEIPGSRFTLEITKD